MQVVSVCDILVLYLTCILKYVTIISFWVTSDIHDNMRYSIITYVGTWVFIRYVHRIFHTYDT